MNRLATSETDLSALRTALGRRLVAADDEGYDLARQAWNLAIDQRPAAVVFPETAADVAATVDFAAENGLRVAAQGTGHAAGAIETLEDAILVRTTRMSTVEIDPVARRARVAAGALWGEVAVAAGEHGLAALHGSSPDVGVVGYSLGGGLGWLGRSHGLASNSVLAIELVTAQGEELRVDADHEAELFWALRGGGGAFGVVTAMEFTLFPLETVHAGSLSFPAENASEVMHAYREWAPTVPREVTSSARLMHLPPLPEVPEPLRGQAFVNITSVFQGSAAEGDELLRPLREVAPAMLDNCAMVPAPALCSIAGDPAQPTPGISDTALIGELTPEAVDTLVRVAEPGPENPLLMTDLRHLGGALGEAPEGAGALTGIDGEFMLFSVGLLMAPEMKTPIESKLAEVMDAAAPYATGGRYLNFAERSLSSAVGYPADVYERLKSAKATYDPQDVFLSSHPID